MNTLIVLDIDGTLVDGKGHISVDNVATLEMLSASGHRLAVVTGRGLPRARVALDPIKHLLTDSFLALEHGGRIVRKGKLEFYAQVGKTQIDRFVGALPPEGLVFAAWHPRSNPDWSYVWAPISSKRSQLESRFSDAQFIDSDWSSISDFINQSIPCMLTARLDSPYTLVDRSVTTWDSGNLTLVADQELKGRAVRWIAYQQGFPRESVIVAGDDLADASMLGFVPPSNRVLVGTRLLGSAVDEDGVQYVSGPEELGDALQHAIGQLPR